jgi:Na+/H+-dicarboxylate symporter
MKTWITYPAAVIFGIAASLLLHDWQPYVTFLDAVVPIARQLGIFMLFPIVFTLFTAAAASLRRYKDTFIVFSSAIFWGLCTTIALSFLGMALAQVSPIPFAMTSGEHTTSLSFFDFSSLPSLFISENAFTQFAHTSASLLPIMVVAFLFGIALRPNREVLRPAYVVVNSFAEAMLRLARIMTVITAVLVLFISAQWYLEFPLSTVVSHHLLFSISILLVAVIALLVVLPLLFGLFSRFKGGNPYSMLLGSLGALLASGFSGSLLFGTTSILALSQKNCGVRKRVGGIATPLLTIIGRGGSALIATFLVINILQSNGAELSMQSMATIALFSALFSLGASFSAGLEVPFIMVFVMQGMQVDNSLLFSSGILILLPLLRLASLSVDTMVAVYGSVFGSRIVSADDRVAIEDMM